MASGFTRTRCDFIGNLLGPDRMPVFGTTHALCKLREALESDGLELIDVSPDELTQETGPTIALFQSLLDSLDENDEPDSDDDNKALDYVAEPDYCTSGAGGTSEHRSGAAHTRSTTAESSVGSPDDELDTAESRVNAAGQHAASRLIDCTGGVDGQAEFWSQLWSEIDDVPTPPPDVHLPYNVGILTITTEHSSSPTFEVRIFATSDEDPETAKVVWAVYWLDDSGGNRISESWQVLGTRIEHRNSVSRPQPCSDVLGRADQSIPTVSPEVERLVTTRKLLQHIAVSALIESENASISSPRNRDAERAIEAPSNGNLGTLMPFNGATSASPGQAEDPPVSARVGKRARSGSSHDTGPPRKKQSQLKQARDAIDLKMTPPEEILFGDPDLVRQEVLLYVARFYSNTQIFDALNATKSARGQRPIKSTNNITKLISIAINAVAAKTAGITKEDLRRELKEAREANGVTRGASNTRMTGTVGRAERQSQTPAEPPPARASVPDSEHHPQGSIGQAAAGSSQYTDDEWRLINALRNAKFDSAEGQ